jgi:hypothetical protein
VIFQPKDSVDGVTLPQAHIDRDKVGLLLPRAREMGASSRVVRERGAGREMREPASRAGGPGRKCDKPVHPCGCATIARPARRAAPRVVPVLLVHIILRLYG